MCKTSREIYSSASFFVVSDGIVIAAVTVGELKLILFIFCM
jgi:hypothetical protein